MSQTKAFLKPTISKENMVVEIIPSTRFVEEAEQKDSEGKVIKPAKYATWKIKAISQEENNRLVEQHTHTSKTKNGVVETFDKIGYQQDFILATVVEPKLNDEELLRAWGTLDPAQLASKMLLPGEFSKVVNAIMQVCGFDTDVEELRNEAKN